MEEKEVDDIDREFKEKNKIKDIPTVLIEKETKEEIGKIIQNYISKVDLARQFIEILPLYYDEAGIWWRWHNGLKYWKMIDEVSLLNLISNATRFLNIISSKERTEILNALKQEARMTAPKPLPKFFIQFKEEVVDLKTGLRSVATPEYFYTNPIPFRLGYSPDTPTIDKIFNEWVGKDYTKTLYEIISYCLIPDYPVNRIFCLVGGGMNGKSCFLNLLKKFVGVENCTSTELDLLIKSRFEVTKLHKKLVAIMGETNFNELSQTSILKKLSGGDLIGFEYKNKNPFDEVNYAKIIIATNNLPTTTDKTMGFYRRWLIIDFINQFTEEKDILAEIPEEEYQSLAIKSINILMDLLDKRAFTNEGTPEERMARYEAKSNFLEKFIKENMVEGINSYVTKAEFSKNFNAWCKENRHRQMSDTSIGIEMKRLGFENSIKYFDWMFDGRGGNARVWLDLKWK